MGSVMRTTVFNAGSTGALALDTNLVRKSLLIQNKHATQTIKVKFGSAVVGSDVTQVQTLSFDNTATTGSLVLRWNGNNTAAITPADNAAAVQVKIRAVTGLGSVTVTGDWTAGFVITLTSVTPQSFATDPLLTIFSSSLAIAQVTEVQTVSFDAVPDAGSFKLNFASTATAAIPFTANAAAVQTAVRTLPGLSAATVSGTFTGGFVVTMTGTSGDQALMTVTNNSLTASAVAVVVTVTESTAGVAPSTTTPTIAVTTAGQYADGYTVAAANGVLSFSGETCPIDALYIVASGSNTRVELIEG